MEGTSATRTGRQTSDNHRRVSTTSAASTRRTTSRRQAHAAVVVSHEGRASVRRAREMAERALSSGQRAVTHRAVRSASRRLGRRALLHGPTTSTRGTRVRKPPAVDTLVGRPATELAEGMRIGALWL